MTNQVRKHVSQMSEHEINYLQNILGETWANVQRLNLSYHLRDKIASERTVYSRTLALDCLRDFRECLFEYNVKTYENGNQSARVALRSKGQIKHKGKWCNQIIVVDIMSCVVVTSYLNEVNDHHETIDWSCYNENLNTWEREFKNETI